MANKQTLDDALRPMTMTCGECGGTLTVYPVEHGIGYCPNCSPAWLKSFAQHLTNQERLKHGLTELAYA